jgi:hypothetical protein
MSKLNMQMFIMPAALGAPYCGGSGVRTLKKMDEKHNKYFLCKAGIIKNI